jgi:SAM-dependent methyltransferase
MSDDPAAPQFWESRYETGDTGWDLGQPAPPFVDLLSGPDAPSVGSMIVLGCGRGHDAIFFAQNGFQVTAVDFSRLALNDAHHNADRAGVEVELVEHDLFSLPASYDHRFDYVLEHTCFAAILPSKRNDYVQVVKRLLKPGGLYVALFFAHGRPGGPPFNTTVEEVRDLFSPYFAIERLEAPSRSIEVRMGKELFALMRPLPVA